MENNIIPTNVTGKQTNLDATITFATREQAQSGFKRACKRLLNPHLWHELSGRLSATFTLISPEGYEPRRLAQRGDYYRIDIPGPGSIAGDGFDWVQVDEIDDHSAPEAEEEWFALRLACGRNPNSVKTDTAHFLKDGATSTFLVKRSGNKVMASYHGRNERINANTESIADNIRNTIVAAAAFAGLSEAQWQALIHGLLQEEL